MSWTPGFVPEKSKNRIPHLYQFITHQDARHLFEQHLNKLRERTPLLYFSGTVSGLVSAGFWTNEYLLGGPSLTGSPSLDSTVIILSASASLGSFAWDWMSFNEGSGREQPEVNSYLGSFHPHLTLLTDGWQEQIRQREMPPVMPIDEREYRHQFVRSFRHFRRWGKTLADRARSSRDHRQRLSYWEQAVDLYHHAVGKTMGAGKPHLSELMMGRMISLYGIEIRPPKELQQRYNATRRKLIRIINDQMDKKYQQLGVNLIPKVLTPEPTESLDVRAVLTQPYFF